MVKIIEIHYVIHDRNNFQSRIIEEESFQSYKNNLIKNGNNKQFSVSIPRTCKIENIKHGCKWLECEFVRPLDQARIKHIAYELTLNKGRFVEFEDGSVIDFIKNYDKVRGFTREYDCYFVCEEDINKN